MVTVIVIVCVFVLNFVAAPLVARFVFRRTPPQEGAGEVQLKVFSQKGLRVGVKYNLKGEEVV